MRYWFLLLLYIVLIFIYAYHYKSPTIKPWPQLTSTLDKEPIKNCKQTSDCLPNYICIQGICLPKLLRGEDCNPITGTWQLYKHKYRDFAACTCKNHKLVTQKLVGGNCNVEVACAPNGHYDSVTNKCVCLDGYVAKGLECHQLGAYDRPCEADELETAYTNVGFKASYLAKYKTCFKTPCSFDALSGRPLKYTAFDKEFGCICDPSRGQFGVTINHPDYLDTKGPNACVSIVEDDFDHINAKIYNYFYMGGKPISFIRFEVENTHYVVEPFSTHLDNKKAIFIGQEWPYDYFQYYIKKNKPYSVHVRECKTLWGFIETCDENVWKSNHVLRCTNIAHKINAHNTQHGKSYDILYQYPMCFVDELLDTHYEEMYRGYHILNPYQLTYRLNDELKRFNGLVFEYDYQNGWEVDFATQVDIEQYYNKYAPRWKHDLVDRVENGKSIAQYYSSSPDGPRYYMM